ncbi:MAG: isoprenylcysteine carboxylmethyltransferase family protein [Candidatus Thorarchaeota archaeon]|nr:isoprenylcysteine carboxylmethyltransferase family protein [Candidatus Thorarchaeota archaeon]
MDEIFYRDALAILIIAFFLIRAPSVISASKTEKVAEKKPAREIILVLLNFIGMIGVPFIYILTSWFDIFAFSYPEAIRLFGIVFNIIGLVLLIWVHRALGQHWSMMLELGDEHRLVTKGPYSRVRHPMYTFFYIMVISTALISSNLFVGAFGILTWTLLYVVRVGDEEAMLLEQFGDEYREYMERTGRLLPKIGY